MSTLYVAIPDPTDQIRKRILADLTIQGVTYRAWVDDTGQVTGSKGVPSPGDREALVGQQVTLTLNPWAHPGPTEGIFNGQGENGLSIIVTGGGRFVYAHHEVADVQPVPGGAK